ncbi:MAG TPA: sulfatase-like hydrolase/transferase [Armatimonadota bacterium]|nr:sulfatase-like hydrolase/transferase [Armatimonadota bacterium]
MKRAPNIMIILADDLDYGDIGCYGNARIQTPNIDALAAGGLRFTDFHSSGAVCSPTRAGLLTGRYQQRAGIPGVVTAAGHRDKGLSPDEVTFAKCLRDAGYATGVFGKWHLGYDPKFNPVHHGFDEFRGYVSGNVDYISHHDQTGVHDWWDGDTPIHEEGYTTHLITEHSLRFIEENHDRPFCLYIAHEAPHYPYQVPGDEPVRSDGKGGMGRRKDDVSEEYRTMVEVMDDGVGEVVATVERLGIERETLIFFFSDNGACGEGSNAPLRGGKGNVYEGGHRVPAIAYWPGVVAPDTETAEPTISLDLMPTVLELADAPVPAGHGLDGADLTTLLRGEPLAQERPLFWAHGEQRAMRLGEWKLVIMSPGGPAELYNVAEDMAETIDLADDHPRRVAEMRATLTAWESDVNADQEW